MTVSQDIKKRQGAGEGASPDVLRKAVPDAQARQPGEVQAHLQLGDGAED